MHIPGEGDGRVRMLLAQGRDLYAQRRFEECVETLRKAYQLEPDNSLVRETLFNAYAEHARDLVDSDWHSAEALIEQALEIEPGHALAKSLRALASDLVAKDLKCAEAEIEEVLESYPDDLSLCARCASSQHPQDGLGGLDGQQSLHQNSSASPREWLKGEGPESGEFDLEVAEIQALSTDEETIASQGPNDPQCQSAAADIAQRAATPPPEVERRSEIKQISEVPGPGTTLVPPKPSPQEQSGPKGTPSPRRGRTAASPRGALSAANRAHATKGMQQWALVVAGTVVIVGGVLAVVWHVRRPPKTLPVPPLYVEFVTSPPDANILIDGNPSAHIVQIQPDRTYRVEASKDGYLPALQSLNLKIGSGNPVWTKKELALRPLPLVLRISTDLGGSAIRLDGVDKGTIQAGGDFTVEVEPGSHTLTIASGKSNVMIAFEVGAATMAGLSAPIKTSKNFRGTAVVVTAWRDQARVEADASSVKVGVDYKPAQKVGFGIDLDSLAPGSHELIWGGGKVKKSFETGQAPTLSLFLVTGRKARVTDGRPSKSETAALNPTPPARPAVTTAPSKAQRIRRLYELAYDASLKGKYVEPPEENAIVYAKQVLAIDQNDTYAKGIIERSVNAEVLQAQQALKDNNPLFAQRAANEMAELLPGRSEIAELEKAIAAAGRASQAAHSEQSSAALSFRVMHIHAKKVPIGNEPYCEGILSVTGHHLKFDGQTVSKGGRRPHHLDFSSCSGVEIKKNIRIVGIGQPGFHVRRGAQQDNFIPEKNISLVVGVLQKACS